MPRTSKRVSFDNGRGETLTGILESPGQTPTAYALFSHCFTCTKDLKATVRVSRRLAEHGLAVLRYDFTGLADSEGDFSLSNFTTNCQDLLAAARFLQESYEAPALLIGHSLGGTATAVVANQIPALVPSSPSLPPAQPIAWPTTWTKPTHTSIRRAVAKSLSVASNSH